MMGVHLVTSLAVFRSTDRLDHLVRATDRQNYSSGQNCPSTHVAGKRMPNNAAKRSASSLEDSALCSNLRKAACKCLGGPLSRNSRGGGLKSNISDICVTLENITYKCNHQSAGSMARAPSLLRAQSIVTPARKVWPWDAVLVR